MRCFQMNQRNEPNAHSHLDQDLPSARWQVGSLPGMLSRDQSESRGNHTGEGHSQGWAVREAPEWSEQKCSCRMSRHDWRS